MDLRPHIEKFARRLAEVEAALSDPAAFDNAQQAQELSKEYSRLKDLVASGNSFLKFESELAGNNALLKTEPSGSEIAAMVREDIVRLELLVKFL